MARVIAELHRAPPAPEPQARSMALGRMLVGGGGLGLVSLLAALGRDLPRTPLVALSLLAVVAGALLLVAGRRLPPWAFHGALIGGYAVVALSCHLVAPGTEALAYAMLTVWVALYAGLFFNPAATVAHTVASVSLVGTALALAGGPVIFELTWLAGMTGMVAGVTNWMAYRRARSRLDPLTGVPGARGLADLLDSRMRAAEARGAPLTLGLLDLDEFRAVNASDGTAAGDDLLRRCVADWQRLLPSEASLARRGSDEFVVVLPDVALADGRAVVERLRNAPRDPVTCSAGVAAWTAGDTQSLLLARADTALYAAKLGGRDRTEVTGEDEELAADLRRALDADEIVVHFQPIHAIDDVRLVGFEALVRWQHPVRGLLAPGSFLPAAEASGVIHRLGHRVLHLACQQLRAWQREHPQHERLRVTVNLSTVQLDNLGLVEEVEQALDEHDLDPRSLLLEVTEGALARGEVEKVALLWELRERGVRLIIDDFGTGHSSLSRLRSLPVDVIKIDRSFVRALGGDDAAAEALFSVIVRMAESLGMATVAEGVETERELELVTELGATYAQGYLLARPCPAAEAHQLLVGSPGSSPDRGSELDRDAEAAVASGPAADETGLRVLRSLLIHVVTVTGFEVAYLTRVDLAANEQIVLAAHNLVPARLEVREGARIEWQDSVCRRALLERTSGPQGEIRSPIVGGRVIRAYATVPIELSDGAMFGTLCIVSDEPRQVSEDGERVMAFVARLVAAQVEERRARLSATVGDAGR